MERPGEGGKTPVVEMSEVVARIPSTAGHEKSRGNHPGPSGKAKYSLATDSDKYREGKVKRTPGGE